MASEIRNRFTDTEMQIARETDLPELLSHLGYQVKLPYYRGDGQSADQGPAHLIPLLSRHRRRCDHIPAAVLR